MQTTSKMAGQIAAEAGVSEAEAQVAAYLLDLSRDGRTLDEAAVLLRRERADVRDIARDWGIVFADYQPAKPVVLTWVKPARGEWTLSFNGSIVARVRSNGPGEYVASWERDDAAMSHKGSSAEIAAKRLSREIDRRSIGLFEADDITISFPLPESRAVLLAPVFAENPQRLRSALAA